MNNRTYAPRLSSRRKLALIKQHIANKSITRICEENGISRTIFYKWLNEYDSQAQNASRISLSTKNPKGRNHFRKLPEAEERKLIRVSLKNPKFSMRDISQITGISLGSVFKILKRNYLGSYSLRKNYIDIHGVRIYRLKSVDQKLKMLELYERGEKIAEICRDAGISRTIFYKWLRTYKTSGMKSMALESKRPTGDKHWRSIVGIKDMVINIVEKNPEYSLSQIFEMIQKEGQSVSRSGLYYILKRLNLTTYETRLAYASSSSSSNLKQRMIGQKRPGGLGYFEYLPNILMLSIIGFMVGSVFYLSILTMGQMRLNINFYNSSITLIRNGAKGATGLFNRYAHIKTTSKNAVTDNRRNSRGKVAKPVSNKTTARHEQDLGWGAFAINITKSTGGENRLGVGLVDSEGVTVCDARLNIQIFDSVGRSLDSMTTANGKVRQSGNCAIRSVTNAPDYIAEMPHETNSGVYQLQVMADTQHGRREFSDQFQLAHNGPFRVERVSYPTRVYPLASYPVEIEITPKQDFRGEISENLPKGITASKISDGGVLFRNQEAAEKVIRWKVNLSKGIKYKISYTAHFPLVWPAFYEIGPLRLTDTLTNRIVFQEDRFWQVVADP